MKKAIGYIRVSTLDQSEKGVSLDAQKEKLEAYCKVYDIKLTDILEDAGLSAKNLDRPQLNKALSMLKAGEVDTLIVYKLDRLTRSVADFSKLLKEYFSCEKNPKTLISVNEQLDTQSANGKLALNILMSVAQFESDITSERTKVSLAYRKSQGLHHGEVPTGYKLEDGKVVPGDDYDVILTIKKLRSKGYGVDKIAKALTEKGVPTKRGGQWTGMTVKRILDREIAEITKEVAQ